MRARASTGVRGWRGRPPRRAGACGHAPPRNSFILVYFYWLNTNELRGSAARSKARARPRRPAPYQLLATRAPQLRRPPPPLPPPRPPLSPPHRPGTASPGGRRPPAGPARRPAPAPGPGRQLPPACRAGGAGRSAAREPRGPAGTGSGVSCASRWRGARCEGGRQSGVRRESGRQGVGAWLGRGLPVQTRLKAACSRGGNAADTDAARLNGHCTAKQLTEQGA